MAPTFKTLNDLHMAMPLKDMDAPTLQYYIYDKMFLHRDRVVAERTLETMGWSSYLHRKQTRGARSHMVLTHYVEHPMRNAARLLRYGLSDPLLIDACLLHDVVEDCADVITREVRGEVGRTLDQERSAALEWISLEWASDDLAGIVSRVSNPIYDYPRSLGEKHQDYFDHLEALFASDHPLDIQAFIVKFSDFIDNAVSLKHALDGTSKTEVFVWKRLTKYMKALPLFEDRLSDLAIIAYLPATAINRMEVHLKEGRRSMQELHDLLAVSAPGLT